MLTRRSVMLGAAASAARAFQLPTAGLLPVQVAVSGLTKAAEFYRMLCGTDVRRLPREVTFGLGASTVVLREIEAGRRPGIADFRVLVERFDASRAANQLKASGVDLRTNDSGRFFVDHDGIVVYVTESHA